MNGVVFESLEAIPKKHELVFTHRGRPLGDFRDSFLAACREGLVAAEAGHIVDLAGLIGYYSFVSVTLNTFEVPTPPGAKLLVK